jgi:PilZ domain-containing protein
MPFGADLPKDMRSRRRRRGPRMHSRVPVTIEWHGSAGAAHRESGFTRVVNGHGCLLVSQIEPALKQRLRVTNVSSRRSVDARVVWKGSQRTDGWDVGVELQAADHDFWGVEL